MRKDIFIAGESNVVHSLPSDKAEGFIIVKVIWAIIREREKIIIECGIEYSVIQECAIFPSFSEPRKAKFCR